MNEIFDFAGVAFAIAVSIGLALWLEWLTLRGFMRLMPATRVAPAPAPAVVAQAATDRLSRAKVA